MISVILTPDTLQLLLLYPGPLSLDGLDPQNVAHVRQQLAPIVVRLALGVRQRVVRHVRNSSVIVHVTGAYHFRHNIVHVHVHSNKYI